MYQTFGKFRETKSGLNTETQAIQLLFNFANMQQLATFCR